MKILIVDDDNTKTIQVVSLLKASLDFVEIDTVSDIFGAKRKINNIKYDLLIVDLVIPLREDLAPDELAGKNLVREIQRNTALKSPKYVIGFTQYQQDRETFSSIWNLLVYSPSSIEWQKTLLELINHIKKSSSVADENFAGIKPTIFTEGVTDEKILKESLRIYFPKEIANINIKAEGGVKLVVKKMIVWAFSLPRADGRNLKAIGLLDGDKAGLDGKREFLHYIDRAQSATEACKIRNLDSTYAKEAVELLKSGINFGICIEDLLPPEVMIFAKSKGWTEFRTIDDPKAWNKHDCSLSEFIKRLALTEEKAVYLQRLKKSSKEDFCNYILGLSEEKKRKALQNFEPLLKDVLSYLIVNADGGKS
jgi:CheY-like chemotaxis protein